MFDFLESLDNNSKGKWFRILLAPVWLIFEYICFKKYWKIVLIEFIENDEIIDFLDRNEFGLNNNKLIKKELVENHEFFNGRKPNEIKELIKKEYVTEFSNLISKNCSTNIEDLISLIVSVDIKTTNINDKIYRNTIYTVIIQYCRLWWYNKSKLYTLIWLSVLIVIIFSLYFLFFMI